MVLRNDSDERVALYKDDIETLMFQESELEGAVETATPGVFIKGEKVFTKKVVYGK